MNLCRLNRWKVDIVLILTFHKMLIFIYSDVLFAKPTKVFLALVTNNMIAPFNLFNWSCTVRASFVSFFVNILEILECYTVSATWLLTMPLTLTLKTESDLTFVTN